MLPETSPAADLTTDATPITTPPSAATSVGRATLLRVAAFNLPFALALAVGTALPSGLKALLAGSLIFLVPGLAWTDRRVGDAAVVLYRAVLASFAAAFVTWVAVLLPPGPTSRSAFLLVLAALTNLGLWVGTRRGWYDARPFATPLARTLTAASCLFYLQCYFSAAYFVPALEDQDMELQGTAYGLMHHFTPSMTTNDSSLLYFSHPLLLHALIGESALIAGDLERLRYYYDGTLEVGPPPDDDEDEWEAATLERWKRDFAQFEREPLLVTTRTPNMFLSALLFFPLGFLAFRLTGTLGAALIACLLYATLPEVFVRAAYGGYMAIANFLVLAGSYFYFAAAGLLPERDTPLPSVPLAQRSGFIAAFLGGWADQKTILLPMATLGHAGLRVLTGGKLSELFQRIRSRPEVRAALIVSAGFFAGWAAYVIYGLAIAPEAFYEHHIQFHFLNRVAMTDVNLHEVREDAWSYPSIVALWQQFGDHTGWLLMLVGVPALVLAAKRFRAAEGQLLLWIVAAAVGFSLIDWRQTKHFAQFLPAFVLLIGMLWAALDSRKRQLLGTVLGIAVMWNVYRIVLVMQDFESLKPLPIW
ncbi:MAG: hypothetical protein ABW321_11670 [Polyangiales bacterium]